VGITDRGGGRQFNAAAYDRIPPSLRESESRRSPEEESLLDGILTFAP
jgi:hypothetical protein